MDASVSCPTNRVRRGIFSSTNNGHGASTQQVLQLRARYHKSPSSTPSPYYKRHNQMIASISFTKCAVDRLLSMRITKIQIKNIRISRYFLSIYTHTHTHTQDTRNLECYLSSDYLPYSCYIDSGGNVRLHEKATD